MKLLLANLRIIARAPITLVTLWPILAFVALTGFPGCAGNLGGTSTAPVFDLATAQRDVYAAKEAYGISERLATAYASLARCQVPAVQPCSDPAVLAQITKARNISRDALAAAQTATDTPGFGDSVIQSSIIAMQASLGAFQAISNKYEVK